MLKDWQGFLFGFARIDPSGASRETPLRTNPCFSFPNWIHFDFIVDSIVGSIVGFWQSGANGLLIHTSLGNGFTTGAPWTNRSGFRECATAIILALSCNVLRNVVFAKSPPVCLGLHLRIWHRFGPLFLFHFPVSPSFFYLRFFPPTGGLSLCWHPAGCWS